MIPLNSKYPDKIKIIGNENELCNNDIRIFFKKSVIMQINNFLTNNLPNESGGVLIGNYCINENKSAFILIDSYIIADNSLVTNSKFIITHKSWEYINTTMDSIHKNKIILGWFHSHPGHGILMSDNDNFIHNNFFNPRYMISLIIDPINDIIGCFGWRGDLVKQYPCYYIY